MKTTKMRLLLNLGSTDAARLGLQNQKTMEGDVIDADEKVETAMLRNGWAVVVGDEKKGAESTVTKDVGGNPDHGNPIPPVHRVNK
jgi:hypothetical protein